jgi:hypothetical protein
LRCQARALPDIDEIPGATGWLAVWQWRVVVLHLEDVPSVMPDPVDVPANRELVDLELVDPDVRDLVGARIRGSARDASRDAEHAEFIVEIPRPVIDIRLATPNRSSNDSDDPPHEPTLV